MDSFRLIQHFFTRMSCQYCDNHFEADDIHLIREEHGIHVVSVNCHHCQRQVGVAMVGVDASGEPIGQEPAYTHRFADPELTEAELERLSQFDPISPDDVLEAHHFFQNLDEHWAQRLPKPAEAATPELAEAAPIPETMLQTEDPGL
jgi:hypothetical protein